MSSSKCDSHNRIDTVGKCGRSDPRRRGVLLINTGTPDKPQVPEVRAYLRQFLSDPMVIRLPGGTRWLQGILGRLIARLRAAHSARLYRKIWTDRGSPLKAITQEQASALARMLPGGWEVYVAMRYGQPDVAGTLRRIEADRIEELVVVPMYPQFSRTTSGTVIQETYRALADIGGHVNLAIRASWFDDIGYVQAQARLIAEYAASNDLRPSDTYLLFSAHGLPVSYIRRGDPYQRHLERSVALVAQRLGWPEDQRSLSYQSRMGSSKWLEPATDLRLKALLREGRRRVLICPISFTTDCLETLEEIDVRYRASFESGGGRLYVCPALNAYEPFVAALKNLVLRGRQSMPPSGPKAGPLLRGAHPAESADGDVMSLVLIGVSVANGLGGGRGPRLLHSEGEALCRVKKTHDEVFAQLQRIGREGAAGEAVILNTCHRIELYAWLTRAGDAADRECAVARMRHQLLGEEPDGLRVNVLFGADAWHHLMRTIVGLNSGLPGDTDVIEQFRTACRIAEHAGVGGARLRRLLAEAADLEQGVRTGTAWGRFAAGYCLAAIRRACQLAGLDPASCRHVVIGGSTTSRSILAALSDGFDVSKRQMTLVYRGHHGGQIKQLRAAIGNGKRVRVQSYSEDAVIEAISGADVVYFGIDRNEPVLTAEALRTARQFADKPLMIVDFNSFGSTESVAELDGVTAWDARRLEQEVESLAEQQCADPQFHQAVQEAEQWIEERLPAMAAPFLKLPCAARRASVRPDCNSCWIGRHTIPAGSSAS